MTVHVYTTIDLTDVWAGMDQTEKDDFVKEHIWEFDSDALYNELESRGYFDKK